MTNLNTAFDVAEKYLDIPKMLDAEGELMRRENLRPTLNLSDVFPETKVTAERQKIPQQPKVNLQHEERLQSHFCRCSFLLSSLTGLTNPPPLPPPSQTLWALPVRMRRPS